MDYLTIIGTRSVLLFKPSRHPSGSAPSPDATPTSSLTFPSPVPISIGSLIYLDAEIVHFLIQHVLSCQPSHGLDNVPAPRYMRNEAEVMVWKEIDQCTRFARALGEAVGNAPGGRISEGELKALAKDYGLGLKKETTGESSLSRHSHTSLRGMEDMSDPVLA